MNSIAKRFARIFKKGEQICIYGMDWDTFGYISDIQSDGVTLRQIKDQRSIKYPWNCFEVICHAGFKVWKSKETEVANIFKFKISTHLPRAGESLSPKEVKGTKIKNILVKEDGVYISFANNLKFKKHEILPGYITDKDDSIRVFEGVRYCENTKQKRKEDMKSLERAKKRKADEVHIDIKVGKSDEMNVDGGHDNNLITGMHNLTPKNEVLLYPPRNTTIIIPQHAHITTSLMFLREGYEDIDVESNADLDKIRRNQWKKEEEGTYGGGDPVIFEGVPTGYKTWRNKNGFLMTNYFADIYV